MSLFYLGDGSGDGPDEGYRFGNTLEHFDLHLLFMYNYYIRIILLQIDIHMHFFVEVSVPLQKDICLGQGGQCQKHRDEWRCGPKPCQDDGDCPFSHQCMDSDR